jgi:methionyl-tRNA formyltransferase
MLKIGYFADGKWSHNAFELLIKDNSIKVEFIVPRSDSKDKTLLKLAQKYGIPYLEGVRINSDEFYNVATEFSCDLFVSMSFNQIFKSKITNLPALGTINCHAGKLPFYRGRNILNWVLINDEKDFGITVHFIDKGIDTGDIILQNTYSIEESDSYKTLLEVAYEGCAITLYDAIKKVQAGIFVRIKQTDIHPVGFYCGMRKAGDEYINWNLDSKSIYNFIRAICDPGPKATTFLSNQTVKINSASIIPEAPKYIGKVGQVIGRSKRGFIVKTQDTTIEIFDIESEVKIKMGDCFHGF